MLSAALVVLLVMLHAMLLVMLSMMLLAMFLVGLATLPMLFTIGLSATTF